MLLPFRVSVASPNKSRAEQNYFNIISPVGQKVGIIMTTNKLTNIAKAILDARTIKNKTARTINTHLGLTTE